MIREINLRRVGGSIGATVPKDMADRLQLAVGDRVLAVETPDGVLFTPYREDLATSFATAESLAKRLRSNLRELVIAEQLVDSSPRP